mgnify:FL=1
MIALAMIVLVTVLPEPIVVHASADDCAIIVAIRKAQAAWGLKGPNRPFVVEGQGPDGIIYRQDCDWAASGVGPPVVQKLGEPGPRFAIGRPVYGVGRKTAEADISFVAWAGRGTVPFMSAEHCTLKRSRGAWRVVKCEQGIIT